MALSEGRAVRQGPSRRSLGLVFSWLSQDILGVRKEEMLTAITKLGFWPLIGEESLVCLP